MKKILCSIALFALCIGCQQTPVQIAYTTFASIGATENAAINVAANLKAKSLISDAQWQQVANLHDQFITAYAAAVNVAITVTGSGNTSTMTAPANIVALGNNIATLVTTMTPYPPQPPPIGSIVVTNVVVTNVVRVTTPTNK